MRHRPTERVCSANAFPIRSASQDVFACAMFDVTAIDRPLSRRVVSDITMPPASSPLTLTHTWSRAEVDSAPRDSRSR